MSLYTKIGGRESNSFVTLAEANALMPTLPDAVTEWNALTDAEKEYRLILAASSMAYMSWKGRKPYDGQALSFPRSYPGNPRVIPYAVKEVQCFIAYSVIHRALANRPEDVTEAVTGSRVTRVSLGGLLSVSFSATTIEAGTGVDKVTRSAAFPAYLRLTKYLTQFRGGSIKNTAEITWSTTTTTVPSGTTTTAAVVTTTTAAAQTTTTT